MDTISQSSRIEAFLQTMSTGDTLTSGSIMAVDRSLRLGPVSAYLYSLVKKGRLSPQGKLPRGMIRYEIPREFWEIPHRNNKFPSSGGNGGHPRIKIKTILPQEEHEAAPATEGDRALAHVIFDVALVVEREGLSRPLLRKLLELILRSL